MLALAHEAAVEAGGWGGGYYFARVPLTRLHLHCNDVTSQKWNTSQAFQRCR